MEGRYFIGIKTKDGTTVHVNIDHVLGIEEVDEGCKVVMTSGTVFEIEASAGDFMQTLADIGGW